MSSEETLSAGDVRSVRAESVVIRVEASEPAGRSVARRILVALLTVSILLNVIFLFTSAAQTASGQAGRVQRSHHSGEPSADAKIAVISFSGTIMPPFTERWLKQIEDAREDDSIRGVLLAIDSPGGLVADSHQLYRELAKLREQKPVYVAMKRMAASGGYYLAMGIGEEGRIFAEPTTWTGSIGVIIPRYNASDLAAKVGLRVEPLVTGPLKDSLNPFRELSQQESDVWAAVLKDSFDRFVGLIVENRRGLDEGQVRSLATGQIYTASQALDNGLVDELGYEEDALESLAAAMELAEYEAIEYSSPQTLLDVLLSSTAKQDSGFMDQVLDAAVPKAMYYCSWNPWVPNAAR